MKHLIGFAAICAIAALAPATSTLRASEAPPYNAQRYCTPDKQLAHLGETVTVSGQDGETLVAIGPADVGGLYAAERFDLPGGPYAFPYEIDDELTTPLGGTVTVLVYGAGVVQETCTYDTAPPPGPSCEAEPNPVRAGVYALVFGEHFVGDAANLYVRKATSKYPGPWQGVNIQASGDFVQGQVYAQPGRYVIDVRYNSFTPVVASCTVTVE